MLPWAFRNFAGRLQPVKNILRAARRATKQEALFGFSLEDRLLLVDVDAVLATGAGRHDFAFGCQYSNDKNDEGRVHAIRRFEPNT